MLARACVAVLTALILAGALPQAAQARTHTITCESEDDRRQVCEVSGLDRDSVRLTRRKSDARCTENDSWGTHPNGIWVSRGCRAEFSYRLNDRDDDRGPGSSSGGGLGEITCESHGPLKNCRIDGLHENSVTMLRQLSDTRCLKGRNWGTQPGLIWVESGCRAVFNYTRAHGGGGGSGGGHGGGGGGGGGAVSGRTTCESMGQRQDCRINNLIESSVQRQQQLSGADCIKGMTWGTRPGVIWVDKGCHAEFSYETGGGGGYGGGRDDHRGSGYGGGNDRDEEIHCVSRERKWVHCNVRDIGRARVDLVSGGSECRADKAWGTDGTGIWVRNNCNGRFRVRR